MFRNVSTVHETEDASILTELFASDLVAVVVDDDHRLKGLLTKMDLVDILTHNPDDQL